MGLDSMYIYDMQIIMIVVHWPAPMATINVISVLREYNDQVPSIIHTTTPR